VKETGDAVKMIGMKSETYDAPIKKLKETAKCQMLIQRAD